MNVAKVIPVALFLLVSLLSFSVWAFGARLFPNEPAMYAGCAIVFLGLGGASLLPTSGLNKRESVRFCISFATAFLVFAVLWSVAWFAFRNTTGEIIGSSLGLTALAAILIRWNRWEISLLIATAILFLLYTVGYYLGGFAYAALQGRGPLSVDWEADRATVVVFARLSWGVGLGIGLGWGLVELLYLSRQSSAKPSTQI